MIRLLKRRIDHDPFAGMSRSELAMTGRPYIDAILRSEPIKTVIDDPIIDRTHDIPNSWGGSVPIENPVTYIDREFPKSMHVDGVTFDPAEPAVIHENIEEFVMTKLIAEGFSREAALRAAYWGWGNPAEHAWYRAKGMNPSNVEAALKPLLDRVAARKPDPANIPHDLFMDTYPDGNPLKDVPGTIEKPSLGEMRDAKAIIKKYERLRSVDHDPFHG